MLKCFLLVNSDLFIAIVFAIGFAVCCWFFAIYNNCYEYLNNLQRYPN